MKKKYLTPSTMVRITSLLLCQWPFSEEPPWGYAWPQGEKRKDTKDFIEEDGKLFEEYATYGNLW